MFGGTKGQLTGTFPYSLNFRKKYCGRCLWKNVWILYVSFLFGSCSVCLLEHKWFLVNCLIDTIWPENSNINIRNSPYKCAWIYASMVTHYFSYSCHAFTASCINYVYFICLRFCLHHARPRYCSWHLKQTPSSLASASYL